MVIKGNNNYFSLSLSQMNIWNLESALKDTSVNNICATINITGLVDYVLLQESIQRVIKSDPTIRTRIVTDDHGIPSQYHEKYEREEFPIYDLSHTDSSGLNNWERTTTKEAIPILNRPLYRFSIFKMAENSGGILVKMHHIISDGWSVVLVCNRIAQTYFNLLADIEEVNEDLPSYELHVNEENDYLNSKAYIKDRKYWENILSKYESPAMLKSINSASISPVGKRFSAELPEVLNHAIYDFCIKNRVGPFAVYYMAIAIYFKRLLNCKAFTVGVPIINRTNYIFKQSTGMFVTTLPFYSEVNDNWTFNQFNHALMEDWLEMLRHQRFPFTEIEKLNQHLNGREEKLFDIGLSYQDSQMAQSDDVSVSVSGSWHYSGYQAEQLCIHVTNLKDQRKYAVDYDYLTQYFKEEEIKKLHDTICSILLEALNNPDKPISCLNLIDIDERERVLYSFNNNEADLENISVYEAIERNASKYPDRVAVISNGERLRYSELLYKSEIASSKLSHLKENSLIAVSMVKGIELIEILVGILKAGHCFLLLNPDLPQGRMETILHQSNAELLITDGEMVKGEANIRHNPYYVPKTDDLAYVVYTSGSTGTPKGVEITQQNLLNLGNAMKGIFTKGAVLSICNISFDAYLLDSIVPLINGKTIVIAGPEEEESPRKLAKLIKGYGVGFCSLSPSRLQAFLKEAEFCDALEQMEGILCGGEQFPGNLLRVMKDLMRGKIYNQYGPSETTVAVSLKELSDAESITAGRPMLNCKLYVLDQWLNPLPIGTFGRLYIGGKCVGRGYRNNQELTDESFISNPFESGEMMYFTGDMAAWNEKGEIIIGGRLDNQIKLRGLRVEPEEIAACIANHPKVHQSAARIWDINQQNVLIGYYTSDENVSEIELLTFVATYLPQYMIPAAIIKVDQIPINRNGKIDKDGLPKPEISKDTNTECETSLPLMNKVLDIFRQVLCKEELTMESDYFISGGNSLNAMETLALIYDQLGFSIRIADLYACKNARKLTLYLDEKYGHQHNEEKPKYKPLSKAPKADRYNLSPFQQGIYVQSYLDKTSIAYNMPGIFKLETEPDFKRLEEAFNILIEKDDIFKSEFSQDTDGIHLHIKENAIFSLENLRGDNLEGVRDYFLRPFDLGKAPLIRGGVWHSNEGEWYLFLDSHHIIGDGMSTPIILNRLNDIYCDREINVPFTYLDYIGEDKESINSNEDFWKEYLIDLPEPVILPTDFQRSQNFDFAGDEYEMMLDSESSKMCDDFCKEKGISTFMLFVGAYGVLLSKLSGREDFTIGFPVSGRTIPEAISICGPFINTLPLRFRISGETKIDDYIAQICRDVNDILDNQNTSLEDIIRMLNLPRNAQNPVYQLMFSQSPVDENSFLLGDKRMEFIPIKTGTVKMDITLESREINGNYGFNFSYGTSLFLRDTIEYYGRCLEEIIKNIVSGQADYICKINVLSASDQENLIDGPNYITTPFINMPIHKIIENKINMRPEETAIIFHDQVMTRRQLERRACGIAHLLTEAGAISGQRISLGFTRTTDIIAAMYGILKTGCAYVPLLPSYPEARLSYMLELADVSFVLCDKETIGKLPDNLPCKVVEAVFREEDSYNCRKVSDDDLVNVMFTSGSTGKPKGVMLKHRAVSSLFVSIRELEMRAEGAILCTTNVVFDSFIGETLFPLAMGKTIILADEEEMMLPWKLAGLIESYNAEVFQVTPARLQMCLGNEVFCHAAKKLKLIMLGGEVLTNQLLNKLHNATDAISVNMYGPTEATVYMTMIDVNPGDHITIGRPLHNSRIYVLDEDRNPVIPTAIGELYMAGECLAKGYIKRPDLTEQMFLPDPFFAGERMYKSGDLGRMRLDGSYDFMGRKDAQVKLNGQRVELDEITGVILESEGAAQAATIPVRKADGAMELCSFFVAKTDNESDIKVIKEFLKKNLPQYMIPSRILPIDKMPLTASSKIDIKALEKFIEEGFKESEPTLIMVKTPMTEDQKKDGLSFIMDIWKQILTSKEIDPKVSFFQQGGTSLDALSVLSIYFNHNLEMSLAQFYENPTIMEQIEILGLETGVRETAVKLKKTLVTGATGFFGIHLVKALLDRDDNLTIIAMIRDGSRERLENSLTWYFGEEAANKYSSRIEIIKGDVSKEGFAMEADQLKNMSETIDTIYHTAADVRHYAADRDSFIKTNFDGTVNIIELAKKVGAKLYHMSTCSVSGEQLKNGGKETFTEDDLDIGQIWEDNIYVKSKFLAEEAVLEAISQGLSAKIFRLGRLVGRQSDGVFQRNSNTNAFYLLMEGFDKVGAIPEAVADVEVDLTPVDYAVNQVLALTKSEKNVFHIINAKPPTVRMVAGTVGNNMKIVDNETFTNMLMAASMGSERSKIAVLVDYWYKLRIRPVTVSLSSKKTIEELQRLDFDLNSGKLEVILKYFTFDNARGIEEE